ATRGPSESLAHRRPSHAEGPGPLTFGWQALARDEFAQGDRGHQPVRDMLAAAAELERLEDREARDRRRHRCSGGSANQVPMTRARVRAPATIEESSTDSSIPWMSCASGP